VEQVLAVAMSYFPAYGGAQQEQVSLVLPEPVLDELPDALLYDGALLTEDEVREALTEAELAAPIEDWMTFLHPEQAALVRRTFNGPARIRGAAGTGKTVVGLHRAAYLARVHPQGKVLVTTFVKTLPAVMSSLLVRMAPEVAERVEFVSVHALATRIARERSVKLAINGRRAGDLLKLAWAQLPGEHKTRLSAKAPFEYWKEEVESVIKGRGLTAFDQYADCKRIGRLVRLTVDDRRAVWALFQSYDTALRSEGIHDFHDVVLLAEAAFRTAPAKLYEAIIIDEAQDLSLAMVRLLHGLVGDNADAFTLIGDGQQSIYPGGYVLSEAGISLAGRGVVLDRNYRNTIEVQEFAAQLIADSSYIDLDDEGAITTTDTRGDGPVRHGSAPVLARFASRAEHDAALIAALRSAEMPFGDTAILCNTTWEAETATRLLAAAGVPSISLLDYTGTLVEAVKVGTIKRAKGLEFKFVMLPWTPAAARGQNEERAARDLRERYVAATRARDLLWVGSC
jgi:superfamily I DNA/RNA helicase